MVTERNFRISLGLTLSGAGREFGAGMKASFCFGFERETFELHKVGIVPEILVSDDGGDPERAVRNAIEARERGALCIVGPSSSRCAYRLLQEAVLSDLPIISPGATASRLTRLGARNFFRTTAPNIVRVRHLVALVIDAYSKETVYVYQLDDGEGGYSSDLGSDVMSELNRRGRHARLYKFYPGELPQQVPPVREPIVFCGPSAEAARVVSGLRLKGCRSQVFGFGSNANLLTREMVGSYVVADVDRLDTNPAIHRELHRFEEEVGAGIEPSVAAINMGSALCKLMSRRQFDLNTSTVEQARLLLLDDLRSETQEGIFGPIGFARDGEFVGSEHLVVLEIAERWFRVTFRHVKSQKAKVRPSALATRKAAKYIAGVIGLLAAVLGIIGFFIALPSSCGI